MIAHLTPKTTGYRWLEVNDVIRTIEDRIGGVCNDLKTFVYIRKNNLQHDVSNDSLGGGNITQALTLFTALNFLSKIHYFVHKNGNVDVIDGKPKINETDAFKILIRKLNSNDIKLGLPDDDTTLNIAWSGFRNKLAHVNTVQDGKKVIVFVVNHPKEGVSVDDFLEKNSHHLSFKGDENNRNWVLNADILLAKLPHIKDFVINQLKLKQGSIDLGILREVIG